MLHFIDASCTSSKHFVALAALASENRLNRNKLDFNIYNKLAKATTWAGEEYAHNYSKKQLFNGGLHHLVEFFCVQWHLSTQLPNLSMPQHSCRSHWMHPMHCSDAAPGRLWGFANESHGANGMLHHNVLKSGGKTRSKTMCFHLFRNNCFSIATKSISSVSPIVELSLQQVDTVASSRTAADSALLAWKFEKTIKS